MMVGTKLFAAAAFCVQNTECIRRVRFLILGFVAAGIILSGFVIPAVAAVKVLEYNPDGSVKGITKSESRKTKKPTITRADAAKARGQGVLAADRFVDGELIVVNPSRNFEASVKSLGFSVIEKTSYTSLRLSVFRLRTPSKYTVAQAKALLSRKFSRLNINADHLYDITGVPDAQPSIQLAALSAPRNACGVGVRIGMIDGAINLKHPTLSGQRITYRKFVSKGTKSGPVGHGTAIAGMFIGKQSKQGLGGLLPMAEISAANVQEAGPSSKVVARASNILRAIDWLISEKVHVINFNIAGADNQALRAAIDRAKSRNIIMVAAVGNWGSRTEAAFPAAYSPVIGVTSVNNKERIYSRANRGPYVDFAAKGVRVWVAAPRRGGLYVTGTSYATPMISSLIGLKAAQGKNIGANAIRSYLAKQAIDLGAKGKDKVYGWGLIDPASVCQ
ncbi:MAG: S8 family serine peptidase [Alphaproteobacteria bacterium]